MDRGHFESIEKPCLGIGDFRKAPDEKATDPQTSLVECMRFRPTYDFPRMKSPKNGTIFFFFFDHTWKPYGGQKSTHAWEIFLSGENVPLTWLKNRPTYGFHVSLKI